MGVPFGLIKRVRQPERYADRLARGDRVAIRTPVESRDVVYELIWFGVVPYEGAVTA
jgi:hypothetical protein